MSSQVPCALRERDRWANSTFVGKTTLILRLLIMKQLYVKVLLNPVSLRSTNLEIHVDRLFVFLIPSHTGYGYMIAQVCHSPSIQFAI